MTENLQTSLNRIETLQYKDLEINTSSMRLAARCWGNPEGLPVLGFHGWLDNAATFDHLAPLLPEIYLVSLDLPGHGLSDHRPSGTVYHFVDAVVDALEVVDVLGWEQFSVLGHSMGAAIASYLAGTVPERVRHVLLIEGFGSIVEQPEKMPEVLREAAQDWKRLAGKKTPVYPDTETAVKVRHQVGGIAESSVRTLVARGLQETSEGYTWRSDPRLRIKSRHYLTEEQACAFLKEITAPILLIEAENVKQNRWKELLQKRIPCAKTLRHHLIPGEHHLHLDTPEPIAEVIRKFLTDFA